MKKIVLITLLTLSAFTLKAQYSNEILTAPTSNVYVYVGTLPPSTGGNYHKLKVDILGGAWESFSTGETVYYIANRNALAINQVTTGSSNAGRFSLHAYNNSSGGLDFYILTSSYTAIAISACELGANATTLLTLATQPNPPAGLSEVLPLPIIPVMITDQNGNIGLNTFNPDPNFKLAVKGNIHAQQVNVDLNNWSDYVFNDDYVLKPLNDVKTYIDKNHHLPEIPSAAEVVKNGVNLGEMNKLLMKKVEELTLYLIEKDRQLDEQKKINREQQKVNQSLQQQISDLAKQLKH